MKAVFCFWLDCLLWLLRGKLRVFVFLPLALFLWWGWEPIMIMKVLPTWYSWRGQVEQPSRKAPASNEPFDHPVVAPKDTYEVSLLEDFPLQGVKCFNRVIQGTPEKQRYVLLVREGGQQLVPELYITRWFSGQRREDVKAVFVDLQVVLERVENKLAWWQP